jgi:hypothetical protein
LAAHPIGTDKEESAQACVEQAAKVDFEWWGVQPKVDGKRLANLCESHSNKDYHTAMAFVNNLRLKWLAAKRTSSAAETTNVCDRGVRFDYRLLSFSETYSPKNQVVCVQPVMDHR